LKESGKERKTLEERKCKIMPKAKWFNEILNKLDIQIH
jgi:hypothetical protein